MPPFLAGSHLLDPYFVSKPSEIFEHFLILSCLESKMACSTAGRTGISPAACPLRQQSVGRHRSYLEEHFFGFVTGVSSGFVAGLILGRSDRSAPFSSPSSPP